MLLFVFFCSFKNFFTFFSHCKCVLQHNHSSSFFVKNIQFFKLNFSKKFSDRSWLRQRVDRGVPARRNPSEEEFESAAVLTTSATKQRKPKNHKSSTDCKLARALMPTNCLPMGCSKMTSSILLREKIYYWPCDDIWPRYTTIRQNQSISFLFYDVICGCTLTKCHPFAYFFFTKI